MLERFRHLEPVPACSALRVTEAPKAAVTVERWHDGTATLGSSYEVRTGAGAGLCDAQASLPSLNPQEAVRAGDSDTTEDLDVHVDLCIQTGSALSSIKRQLVFLNC